MKVLRYIIPSVRLRILLYRLGARFLVKPRVNRLHIPIIAITGTNGKSTVAKLLNRIYLEAGYRVGMCCTDGVMVNGSWIHKGDQAGPNGLWRVTRDQHLDLIVAETARGGILRYGVSFKECLASVVTNIYEDHLGDEGVNTLDEMAEVKSTIVRLTRPDGVTVLNADDVRVERMTNCSQAKIMYFTMESGRFAEGFERCFYLADDSIWKKAGDIAKRFVDLSDITVTNGGTQRYQIANTMAALAVVEGLKDRFLVEPESCLKALQEFGRDPRDNLARFSLVQYRGEALLLCFCKNAECYRQDLPLIAELKETMGFDHVVGILCTVGRSLDGHLQDISRIVAPTCDAFAIRPPPKSGLGRRRSKEVMQLLSSAIPPEKILDSHATTLEDVFQLSREKFDGKILFVAFGALFDPSLDVEKILEEHQGSLRTR